MWWLSVIAANLVIAAVGVLGWHLRARAAQDTMDAAKALTEVAQNCVDRVLQAAEVISKTDARLEVIAKSLDKLNAVGDSLDRQQGSILNVLVNSPAFRGERFDFAEQVGERRPVTRGEKDEVPPPLGPPPVRVEGELR